MNLESLSLQHESDEEKIVREYLSNLGLSLADLKGKKVLDVGSGNGAFVRFANQNGVDAVGLDNGNNLNSAVLENIQNNKIPFVLGEANHMPFPDLTFDLVISHAAIPNIASQNFKKEKDTAKDQSFIRSEEQERRINSLKEMLRVLTENGEVRCAPVVGYSSEFKYQASQIREALNKIAENAQVVEEPISQSSFRIVIKKKK